MNFQISEKTKAYINQNAKSFMRVKNPQYYNSPEFYKKRPDLAPDNVYLRMGRILKLEDVQKKFLRFGDPWWKKLLYPFENFFDKIRKIR